MKVAKICIITGILLCLITLGFIFKFEHLLNPHGGGVIVALLGIYGALFVVFIGIIIGSYKIMSNKELRIKSNILVVVLGISSLVGWYIVLKVYV